MEAQLREPAASPHPVAHDGIDERRQDERVGQVGNEAHALCNRSSHNGRGGTCKHRLEEPDCLHRHAVHPRLCAHHQPALGDDDEARGPVHDGVAKDEVANRREPEVQHVLHEHVGGVLGPHHASFHHRKPGLHEEHQDCRDEDPQGAEAVIGGRLGRRVGCGSLLEEDLRRGQHRREGFYETGASHEGRVNK